MPSISILGSRGYPSYYGGFETAVRRLAPYLADQGWEVTVYGRPGTRDDDPDRDPRIATLTTWGMESKSLSTLSYGWSASRHAARSRPDVVLVMNVANGYFLPMLRRRGIPTLVNVDGIEWEREKWGGLARRVFRRGAALTAQHGTRLIVDSERIGDYWRREFARDGVFIPYGADTPGELPVEPGLEHRGYVLLVARLVPENTVEPFFDAAERLAARWPVVVVGSAGYGGGLDDRAATLARVPRVTWLGHVADDRRLLALWAHAGAYFHGHSAGGTNPALVQAMAAGAPVVARDTVFTREVLGDAAVFVTPEAAAIETAIAALMADPDRQRLLSHAAAARATERYTWQGVLDAYERELSDLATAGSIAPR